MVSDGDAARESAPRALAHQQRHHVHAHGNGLERERVRLLAALAEEEEDLLEGRDQRDVATAADARDDSWDPVGEGRGVKRALHKTLEHPLRGGLELSLVLWGERGLDQFNEGVFEGFGVTRLEAKRCNYMYCASSSVIM